MTWVKGKTRAQYEADEYMQSAIERQFEILAEALNIVDRSDPSLREALPEPGEIIGMRNAIAHAYFRIDNDIVWSATQSLLSDIQTRIRQLLGDDVVPSSEIP